MCLIQYRVPPLPDTLKSSLLLLPVGHFCSVISVDSLYIYTTEPAHDHLFTGVVVMVVLEIKPRTSWFPYVVAQAVFKFMASLLLQPQS